MINEFLTNIQISLKHVILSFFFLNWSFSSLTSESFLLKYSFCKVLSAATLIAKHTSSLCNTCRVASSKTSNPVAKRHFVQSAKDVANSTANLVRTIKVSDFLIIIFHFNFPRNTQQLRTNNRLKFPRSLTATSRMKIAESAEKQRNHCYRRLKRCLRSHRLLNSLAFQQRSAIKFVYFCSFSFLSQFTQNREISFFQFSANK